jgi:FkbM family methyltransferase
MKVLTYARYFWDYMKFGDPCSVIASVKYIVNKSSHSSDRVIRTSSGKFYCRKNTNDFQFANYYYEWGVKKYLLNHKNDFNVFIDGGACTGEYSIILSRYNIRCFAFEPIMATYFILLKNLEMNGLADKVKSFSFGLGEQNIETSFVFNPVNTGASHLAEPNQTGDYKVDIRTFDSVYRSLDISKEDHIFFKLDVEGMEPEALRGAENFIREFPNITFIMEDKHSGEDLIKNTLSSISSFEYGTVDEFNIYAKKLNVN